MNMEISPERWQQIDALLDQVLDQPEQAQLDFLKTRCGGDNELYREVAALKHLFTIPIFTIPKIAKKPDR